MPGDFTTEDLTALSRCETCQRPASENLQASKAERRSYQIPVHDDTERTASESQANTIDAERTPKSAGTLSGQQTENLAESSYCETCQSSALKLDISDADPDASGRSGLLTPIQLPGISGWAHQCNDYSDFNRKRLLLHMRSTEVPSLCSGYINGDGLVDLHLSVFLVQQTDGTLSERTPAALEQDADSEDTDCTLFDDNGDGLADRYVTSGGKSFPTGSSALLDLLFMDGGEGEFTRSEQVLLIRRGYASTPSVAVGDMTGNGQDLFVGERLRLFSVGLPAAELLLAKNVEKILLK